jgi:universal stress protein A
VFQIRTVLCPVDFTAISERELHLANRICERFDAHLVVEHNLQPAPPLQMGVSWMWPETQEPQEDPGQKAKDRLKEILNRLPHSISREARLTRGPLDLALLYVARDVSADLVVMGSHGRSTVEHHSLTEEIIVRAPCCVLTLTEESELGALFEKSDTDGRRMVRTLVPAAFSKHGRTTMSLAFEMARALPLHLTLLHVDGSGDSDRVAAEHDLQALIPADLSGRVDCAAIPGQPAEGILRHCAEMNAGLMIMGSHRRGLLTDIFSGATPREILHGSRCPVWFVPTASPRVRRCVEGAS